MKKIFLLLFVPVLLFIASCSKDLYPLKFAPEQGKSYRIKTLAEQDISQEMMGQKIKIKQTMEMTYLFSVKESKEKGVSRIDVTYERIKVDQQNDLMPISFDSDVEEDPNSTNPFGVAFSALKGSKFSMLVGENGSVMKVEGIEEMISQMMNKVNELLVSDTSKVKSDVLDMVKSEYSEEKIRKQMEASLKIFPDKQVSVGDSWKIKNIVDGVVPMETETEYHLKDIRSDVAVLDVKGTFDIDQSSAMGKIKLKGTQEGEMTVDKATGFTLKSKITQKMSGTSEAMGMSLPMDINSVTTTTSEKL